MLWTIVQVLFLFNGILYLLFSNQLIIDETSSY